MSKLTDAPNTTSMVVATDDALWVRLPYLPTYVADKTSAQVFPARDALGGCFPACIKVADTLEGLRDAYRLAEELCALGRATTGYERIKFALWLPFFASDLCALDAEVADYVCGRLEQELSLPLDLMSACRYAREQLCAQAYASDIAWMPACSFALVCRAEPLIAEADEAIAADVRAGLCEFEAALLADARVAGVRDFRWLGSDNIAPLFSELGRTPVTRAAVARLAQVLADGCWADYRLSCAAA